jgi:hypothetical protein
MENEIITERLKKIQKETSDLYYDLAKEIETESSGFRSAKLSILSLDVGMANRSISQGIKTMEIKDE